MLISNLLQFVQSKGNFIPKTILDIGSRDLQQSIEFHSKWPEAKIYAFEPTPEQFHICNELAAGYDNIQVYQLAIGDKKGVVDFYKTLGNIGASSLLEPIDIPFSSNQDVEKISVKVDTLENWMAYANVPKADILWIDTQGTELLALKGMGSSLRDVKSLHCEASPQAYYKGHGLKIDLEQFLMDEGFALEFHPCLHPYGEGDIFAVNTRI